MSDFMEKLLLTIEEASFELDGFCVLPNHYHILAKGTEVAHLRLALGKLHGRTSRLWNLSDACTGRKVWFRSFDKLIRSTRQYYATLNYIHYNPIKHGYCQKVTDWKWSSATSFIEQVGRENASKIWKSYPIKDSGIEE